jgi:hypothetical protein
VDDDDIPEKVPRPSVALLQNASEYQQVLHRENIPIRIASIDCIVDLLSKSIESFRVRTLGEESMCEFPNVIFGLSRDDTKLIPRRRILNSAVHLYAAVNSRHPERGF